MNKELTIVIDQEMVDAYNQFYFSEHPKAYTPQITEVHHPSMNKWMIMSRPAMNNLKQKWKAFMIWICDSRGLSGMNIDRCSMRYVLYFPSKNHRRDNSNYTPKFIEDGLVDAHFLIDDSAEHVLSLSIESNHYSKENPRTEIIITILDGGSSNENY